MKISFVLLIVPCFYSMLANAGQVDFSKSENKNNSKFIFDNNVCSETYNNYYSQKEKETSVFGGVGFSDVIAFLALVVSGVSFYKSRKDEIIKLVRSVDDDFWMRDIIVPTFIEPLINLVKNAPVMYRSANSIKDFYSEYYLEISNDIRDRAILFSVITDGMDTDIRNIIDFSDDEISSVNSETELITKISDLYVKIVSRIKKEQITIPAKLGV